MKPPPALPALVCFAASALAVWAWRPAGSLSGNARALPPGSTAPVGPVPTADAAAGPSAGFLEKLGISARPTLHEVFAAVGVDRNLRMTVFIQNATSAELAEALVRADEEGALHSSLTDQIWLRWAELDPAAAVASQHNWGQAWWAWGKTDPQAALAAARGNTDHLVRVIRSIGDGDPDWARRLIAEHPEADQPMVWDGVLESLTKQDPAAAAALAMERKANLKGVLGEWASRQPDAARAWIEALPDGSIKRKAMQDFVRKRVTMDPAASLPEAVSLPPGQDRDEILTAAVTGLAVTDPAGAAAVAEKLPPGDGRQQALGALAEELVADDPAKALAVLSKISWKDITSDAALEYHVKGGRGICSSPGRAAWLSSFGALEKLVDQDAANTLDMLASLPAERAIPLDEAIWQWSGKEPEAASLWLRDQPAGEARDRGIEGLVRRLTDMGATDFETALIWAASATPAARDKLLRGALNSYAASDLEAAAVAAEKLGIQPGPMAKHFPGRPY